jgi:hypothetical protein
LRFVFRQSLLEETIDRGVRHSLANRIKNSLGCFIVLRMKNPYETDALGPVGRSLSLRDPRRVEVATKSDEYNARRGSFAQRWQFPRKCWLIGSRERTVRLMHNNQAGPELFAERVLP